MEIRTPITLISGPLGSGKTTLLRHVLSLQPRRLAILINEFGEIAIDSKILEGKSIRIAELANGCVCCSLQGEFEAAVNETLDTVNPERIIVETSGVAEPDALVFDIQDNLPRVRLDGVITIADADALVRFPRLGHTARMQVEAADMVILNKEDLVSPEALELAREKLQRINGAASIFAAQRCRVDPDLLFGIGREYTLRPPEHLHQPGVESFFFRTPAELDRECFEKVAACLGQKVHRAKGFVRFPEGSYLFNFVSGRWELEPFPGENTVLVFIGQGLRERESEILARLRDCGG